MGRIFSHCVWQPKTIANAFKVARYNNFVATPFIFKSRCAYFGCLPSLIRSFTEICKSEEFRDILELLKKGINYAWTEDWNLRRQICYFLDISGKVLSLIRFANDPYTLYNRLNISRLGRFRKARNHVNRGKTQCWALFVTAKAAFTKTAVKPKFDDRFPLKNFSAAIDHCAIKCPIFFVHWNVLVKWSKRRLRTIQQKKDKDKTYDYKSLLFPHVYGPHNKLSAFIKSGIFRLLLQCCDRYKK